MSIDVEYLGRRDFASVWTYQRELFEKRLRNETGDRLLLVEHDPVITIGKTGSDANVVTDTGILESKGIDVVHIDRGGDVTFHGPGQLVGYPILRLENYYRDVHRYLRDIEEVLIRTLAGFGITAGREQGLTGVWTGGEKIAAIGVKVSRWITMHGFALNVDTELRMFDTIVPCGITDKRVTSMRKVLGGPVDFEQVADAVATTFPKVFSVNEQAAVL